MKIILLDASTLGEVSNLAEIEQFGEFTKYGVTRPDQTINRLRGVDIVITNKVVIDKTGDARMPYLKINMRCCYRYK